MLKFKLKKLFVDNDRQEYSPGDFIELDVDSDNHGPESMKVHRMIAFGIIHATPKKKRGRKRKTERAVSL